MSVLDNLKNVTPAEREIYHSEISRQPKPLSYGEYDNIICKLEDYKVLLDGHSHELEVLKARVGKLEPSGVTVE